MYFRITGEFRIYPFGAPITFFQKKVKKGVDKAWKSWYNSQCCREKRQRRSLKTIQREIIVQETVRF